MSNSYEDKKQARIDRYRERAAKAQDESNALSDESRRMIAAIPMGQPLMPDHYSYKADRNYRDRAWNKMGKAVEAGKKADYYEQKAEAAESNTAISSDDPTAVEKLKERLAELESFQTEAKKMNAYYRKHKTMAGYGDLSDEAAARFDERIKGGYSWAQQPVAPYRLQNNNANIQRIKKRIATLERVRGAEAREWTFDGGKIVANTEENRLQILFDEKPDDNQRSELKSRGFRWSPTNKAWQRQLSSNAIYSVKRISFIKPHAGTDAIKLGASKKKDAPSF